MHFVHQLVMANPAVTSAVSVPPVASTSRGGIRTRGSERQNNVHVLQLLDIGPPEFRCAEPAEGAPCIALVGYASIRQLKYRRRCIIFRGRRGIEIFGMGSPKPQIPGAVSRYRVIVVHMTHRSWVLP
jgi:hypothetical protein